MTRREVISLVKNAYVSFLLGGILSGCDFSTNGKTAISSLIPRLAFFLGYLLYGENSPRDKVEEMKNHIKIVALNSLRKRRELESLYDRIAQKNRNSSFETLSPENKEIYFQEIMPHLEGSPVILEILKHCLEGEEVLQYIDYPDLSGDPGECGRLVLEGDVWDRYYPPSG